MIPTPIVGEVNVGEVVRDRVSMRVRITGMREFKVRKTIGLFFIKLGALVIGFREVKFELDKN